MSENWSVNPQQNENYPSMALTAKIIQIIVAAIARLQSTEAENFKSSETVFLYRNVLLRLLLTRFAPSIVAILFVIESFPSDFPKRR